MVSRLFLSEVGVGEGGFDLHKVELVRLPVEGKPPQAMLDTVEPIRQRSRVMHLSTQKGSGTARKHKPQFDGLVRPFLGGLGSQPAS